MLSRITSLRPSDKPGLKTRLKTYPDKPKLFSKGKHLEGEGHTLFSKHSVMERSLEMLANQTTNPIKPPSQ